MEKQTALPGPLGLLGFGMTTILLNLHNAGLFPMNAMILAMGIFYGGIAQLIAGQLEFKEGNSFGFLAFTSYGMFWLTLVFLILAPQWGIAAASEEAMAWYLFLWGVFTLFMFMGTQKKGGVLRFVFASLTVLFVLLAVHAWTGIALIGKIAGWEGILCGASAFYLGMAELLKETRGRKVLPF
jgi:succinate-acetate transporter protein